MFTEFQHISQRENKQLTAKGSRFDRFHYIARLMTSQNETIGQDEKLQKPVSSTHSSFKSENTIFHKLSEFGIPPN